MDYVQYGKTDMKVSRLAFGCMPFGSPSKASGFDPTTEESMQQAERAIDCALDNGINVLDTADNYGGGLSEIMVGRVMKRRRDDCYLWTKCQPFLSYDEVIAACEASLRRLNTDHLDLYQLHGGSFGFTPEQQEYILKGGPLDALLELKRRGLTRYIGVTSEEHSDLVPLVLSDQFDSVQICYNIIRQGASVKFLKLCKEHNVGISIMRPNTSGIFQRELASLMPELNENGKSSELAISFAISDSRIDAILLGMRSPERVMQNVNFYNNFKVPRDIADMPMMTAKVYMEQDREAGFDVKPEDYLVNAKGDPSIKK